MEQFSVVPLPDTHPARRHFGFGQNDAEVLDIVVGQDYLEVKLSHYDIGRLACELVDDPPGAWAVMRYAFPVTFRFAGVSELVILRSVEQGVYQKIRSAQRSIKRAVHDVISMDCVDYAADRQRYLLRLNGAGSRFQRGAVGGCAYKNGYALCIEARALKVKEEYREGWLRMFSGKHLDILDRFEMVWPVPSWAMVDFEQWLIDGKPKRATASPV